MSADIRGFSHVAIGVTDMERSLLFYRDVIGLSVTADRTEEFKDLATGAPRKRRGLYLRWGQQTGSFLVLDQQLSIEPFGQPAAFFQVGVHHFSFWVDDIDARLGRARAHGFDVSLEPILSDTADYGEPPGGQIRTAILSDPDGNLVQLDQRV